MVFLVFGSLLPLVHEMQTRLELKKERYAAYETLHEAAKVIAVSDSDAGSRIVNGIVYYWEAEGHCVEYTNFRGQEQNICLN